MGYTKKRPGLGILNADSKTKGLHRDRFSRKSDNFTYLSLWITILSIRVCEYKYVYVKIRLFAIQEMYDI